MTVAAIAHRLARAAACLLVAWSIGGQALAATTYYVRTNGGDASQCTGKANVAYPGTGTGLACAWKHPYYALPPNDTARIAGGDTLIIGPGSYMIGFGAPGASDKPGRCYAGGPYDCYLPKVPSGTPGGRTRILGAGYATGCTAPPQLWGTQRVSLMINLQGSSNIEIGCLEVTDHSDCVEFHTTASVRCVRDAPPYGDWAGVGISASDSANVWLHDLNIHGLANRGLIGGRLTDWTVERVKINGNGWAGWDGDISNGNTAVSSSNSGNIILRQVEIAWNGCGQRWQTGVYYACWAQTASGYGDGIGTGRTGGNWLIEDSFVHHNTSDGIDLLYMDGAANSSVIVRRVYAAGNAGNQVKTNGAATIENSVIIGNCTFFLGRDYMTTDDACRALGNTVSVAIPAAATTVNIRHNTIIGEGDCLIISGGGTTNSRVNIQNNALLGQLDWRSNLQGNIGELTCGHYADASTAVVAFSGNLFWGVKANQCPAGSVCAKDPKLTNASMANFDAEPLVGSPLINAAPLIAAAGPDFYLRPRPSGAGADIGAIEKQGTGTGDSTAPVITSMQVSGSGIVTLSATASDASGIAQVTFLVDGNVVGSASAAPFSIAITSASIGYGQHNFTVRASDPLGNAVTSKGLGFLVDKYDYQVGGPGKIGTTPARKNQPGSVKPSMPVKRLAPAPRRNTAALPR